MGEGEGGKIWENGIKTCIILIASPGSMQDTGCLGLVHWDDPEVWYAEGGGRGGSGWGARVHPWQIHVDGVAKSRIRLSDFTFTFHLHALEKEMASHSSILAWRIPGTGEPGGLPSMGSHRVGHD